MADDNDGACIIGEHFLQQVERFKVEIIGRLVQHQEIRRQRQRAGQGQPPALAARQPLHWSARLLGAKQKILHIANDMLFRAIDFHPVAAPAQGVRQDRAGCQRGAGLVEFCHFQRRAQLHTAGIRLQRAGHQIDQRGLASAIGADNADPVAALDADRKIPDDGAPAVALRNAFAFHHQLARCAPGRGFQPDVAGNAPRLAPVGAQFGQPRQPPLVALAAAGDTIAHPVLFHDNLAVELVAVALFLFQHGVAPGLEIGKSSIQPTGDAAVQPQRRFGQVAQETPVMADQHHGGAQRGQFGFQPFDDGQIEMVGRLVEQQNVRLGCQGPRQSRAPGLAARQCAGVLIAGQAKFVEQVERAVMVVVGAHAGLDIGQRCRLDRHVRLLRQIAHGGVGLEKAQAAILFKLAGGDFQQRRFARSIAPDKAQALARSDAQAGPFQKRLAAKRQTNILQRQKGRCHACFQTVTRPAFDTLVLRSSRQCC